MRILDRYLIKEVLGPMGLGISIYTFIFLLRFIFKSAELIIKRGMSVSDVLELLSHAIPGILVLTIPMALLFAILIATGRISADSELVAIRASGVSLFSLYRPIFLVSLVFTLITLYLTTYQLPKSNKALEDQRRSISLTVLGAIEPKTYTEVEGNTIYIFEDTGQDWRGIFVAPPEFSQNRPRDKDTPPPPITVAPRGSIENRENGEMVLKLDDALMHTFQPDRPERYELWQRDVEQVLNEGQLREQKKGRPKDSKRTLRSLNLSELKEALENDDLPETVRHIARVEIHKKMAFPVACLVFGLLALPLGIDQRRGGRSSGFVLSLVVILVYYILTSNGEDAAQAGKMAPWLAMWLPNILLTAFGLLLLARKNSDKSLMLSRFDRWVRNRNWASAIPIRRRESVTKSMKIKIRKKQQEASIRVVIKWPRPRLRFPNILDRYVMGIFTRVIVLTGFSFLTLMLVGELTEDLPHILKTRPPIAAVVSYYQFISLQRLYEISPVIVLVTALLTLSLLTRTNEVTVIKALGTSLFRLAIPVLAISALVGILSFVVQSEVLPSSNQRAAELHDIIQGRKASRSHRSNHQWIFGREGRYMFHFLHFDPRKSRLRRFEVLEFDPQYRLSRRIYANNANYTPEGWLMDKGWIRTFNGAQETSFKSFDNGLLSRFREEPNYFTSEIKKPEEMDYRRLAEYISELKRRGELVPEFEVELHRKIAYPTISFIMALVALPFGFRLGKKGALYGIGVSLFLGMIFLAIFAFFATLGEAGSLPPLVAAWSPNVLFGLFSLYLFLGVRT